MVQASFIILLASIASASDSLLSCAAQYTCNGDTECNVGRYSGSTWKCVNNRCQAPQCDPWNPCQNSSEVCTNDVCTPIVWVPHGQACEEPQYMCTNGECTSNLCMNVCYDDTSCLSGYRCVNGACHIWVEKEVAYDPCGANKTHYFTCANGLRCITHSTNASYCTPPKRRGCTGCTANSDCAQNLCVSGTCLDVALSSGSHCVVDAQCITGKCQSGVCKTGPDCFSLQCNANQICSNKTGTWACYQTYDYCLSLNQTWDPSNVGVCVNPIVQGGNCTLDIQCAQGMYCNRIRYVCDTTAYASAGDSCSLFTNYCNPATTYCDLGKSLCVSKDTFNDPCSTGTCAQGLICSPPLGTDTQGTCMEDATGDMCNATADCQVKCSNCRFDCFCPASGRGNSTCQLKSGPTPAAQPVAPPAVPIGPCNDIINQMQLDPQCTPYVIATRAHVGVNNYLVSYYPSAYERWPTSCLNRLAQGLCCSYCSSNPELSAERTVPLSDSSMFLSCLPGKQSFTITPITPPNCSLPYFTASQWRDYSCKGVVPVAPTPGPTTQPPIPRGTLLPNSALSLSGVASIAITISSVLLFLL